jgi:hypothetical protein
LTDQEGLDGLLQLVTQRIEHHIEVDYPHPQRYPSSVGAGHREVVGDTDSVGV